MGSQAVKTYRRWTSYHRLFIIKNGLWLFPTAKHDHSTAGCNSWNCGIHQPWWHGVILANYFLETHQEPASGLEIPAIFVPRTFQFVCCGRSSHSSHWVFWLVGWQVGFLLAANGEYFEAQQLSSFFRSVWWLMISRAWSRSIGAATWRFTL